MSYIQRRFMKPSDCACVIDQLNAYNAHFSSCVSEKILSPLIQQRAISGLLIEKLDAADGSEKTRLISVGITGCISLEVASRYIDTGSELPLVDYLYQLEDQGHPALLRPDQIAVANANEGLAVVVMHYSAPQDANSQEAQEAVLLAQSSFRIHNGGYHCKLVLHPVPKTDQGLNSLLAQGFSTIPNNPGALIFDMEHVKNIPFHPFASLRQLAKPIIGFSQSEQRLLTLALLGRRDSEIAYDLNISHETIRKRWRAIFQRIEDCKALSLFPVKNDNTTTRGPEKRSTVLRYLEANLAEVRPFKVV